MKDKIKVYGKQVEGTILASDYDMYWILFQKDESKNEVDVFYFNREEDCYKSEVLAMGEGYEYQVIFTLEEEDAFNILDYLREHNFILKSCVEE